MQAVDQSELYFQTISQERRESERGWLFDQFPECETRSAQVLNPNAMPDGRFYGIDNDVMGIRLFRYCIADIQRRDAISTSHFKGALNSVTFYACGDALTFVSRNIAGLQRQRVAVLILYRSRG